MRIAHNSKLKIQNSKFLIGVADNSKLTIQNSQLKMRIAHNSKFTTQNSQLKYALLLQSSPSWFPLHSALQQ